MEIFEPISQVIKGFKKPKRSDELDSIAELIYNHLQNTSELSINYICTHNSRRSQFSQIWSDVAVAYYQLPIRSYSGGVEVTAFNPRAVQSCKRLGFQVSTKDNNLKDNPKYEVSFSDQAAPSLCFSKTFDDISSPNSNFFAMMTCGHADENCPFIPGALKRIPFRFEDPKAFDDTALEADKYDERSIEIGSEIFYILGEVSRKFNNHVN